MFSLADYLQLTNNQEESQLLLSLFQHEQEREMTLNCLLKKEQENSAFNETLIKLRQALFNKEQHNHEIQTEIKARDKDSQLYKDHLRHIEKQIMREQSQIDPKILDVIAIKTVFKERFTEEQRIWSDLLGQKIKFIPSHNILKQRWNIQDRQHSVTVTKNNSQAGYTKLTSIHPLPSKGRFYISFICQSNSAPSFLAGLTNKRPSLYPVLDPPFPQSIFMNFSKMTFQNENKILSECPYFIQGKSSVVCLFECSNKKMLVIIDTYFAGEVSLTDFGNDYCYFFIGIGSKDTVLTFDHSDAISFF